MAAVRVSFAPEDLKGGKKLHEQLFGAIQIHDRLLIVLSEHSIQSEWVMTEIRKARETEKKEKRASYFPFGWGFEVRHLTPTLSGLNCFSPTTLTCPADILSRSRERGISFEAEREKIFARLDLF